MPLFFSVSHRDLGAYGSELHMGTHIHSYISSVKNPLVYWEKVGYWKGIITIYYWNSQIAINTPVEPIRNQLTLKFFPDPSKDGPMVLETPKTAKTHKYNFWQYYISSMVVIQNHNSDTKTMVMFDSIVSLYHPFFPCLGPQILPLPMVKCHTWAAMALAGRWKRGDSPCETTRVAQCICGSAETGSAPKHPGISQKISCNLQETAQ